MTQSDSTHIPTHGAHDHAGIVDESLPDIASELVSNGSIELSVGDDQQIPKAAKLLPFGMSVFVPSPPKRDLMSSLEHVQAHDQELFGQLIDGLNSLESVTLYGPLGSEWHGGALSFNIKNIDPAMLGFRLDREYGICCRVGLHCAPSAHDTIGTLPEGTVRLSPGYFNTTDDIEQTLAALRTIIATES